MAVNFNKFFHEITGIFSHHFLEGGGTWVKLFKNIGGPRVAGHWCRAQMSAFAVFTLGYATPVVRFTPESVWMQLRPKKVLLCSGNGIPAILSWTAAILTEPPDLQCSTELIRVPYPLPFCKAVLSATYDCTKAITLVVTLCRSYIHSSGG